MRGRTTDDLVVISRSAFLIARAGQYSLPASHISYLYKAFLDTQPSQMLRCLWRRGPADALSVGNNREPSDLAEVGAVGVGHHVAVSAVSEAAPEALEDRVRGIQLQHRDRGEV